MLLPALHWDTLLQLLHARLAVLSGAAAVTLLLVAAFAHACLALTTPLSP
jgi:hypothetical protein